MKSKATETCTNKKENINQTKQKAMALLRSKLKKMKSDICNRSSSCKEKAFRLPLFEVKSKEEAFRLTSEYTLQSYHNMSNRLKDKITAVYFISETMMTYIL
jgi:hypothetical protein